MQSPIFAHTFTRTGLALLTSAMLLSGFGCQKKCQQSKVRYSSLVDTQWRLVETTDPDILEAGLSNFDFQVFTFTSNGAGTINQVISNELYQSPIATLVWVPNPPDKTVRIEYTSAAVPNQTPPQPGDLGTFDYVEMLGTDLKLTDQNRGFYYRFVPFTGIVNPDTVCVF